MTGMWVLILPKAVLVGLLTWGMIVARRQAASVEARRRAARAAPAAPPLPGAAETAPEPLRVAA